MHLAIIPDGNRRWAREKGLPEFLGHKEGAKRIEEIITAAFDCGVSCLSIWGASVANLTKREKKEIDFVYGIFGDLFKKLLASDDVKNRSIRISVIGKWKEFFSEELNSLAEKVQSDTLENTGPRLNLMLAYSGTCDMREAFAEVTRRAGKENLEISDDLIKSVLSTKDIPPVDLLIRTGGEPHLSDGFMMWDMANAQLYFTEKFWPDFSKDELNKAIARYSATERRMGA